MATMALARESPKARKAAPARAGALKLNGISSEAVERATRQNLAPVARRAQEKKAPPT